MFPTTISRSTPSRVRLISIATPAEEQSLVPPPGYAVAMLPNGSAMPLGIIPYQRTEDEETLDAPAFGVYTLDWRFEAIPPALGPWRRTGTITCATYADACLWCLRRQENAHLLDQCQEQTAHLEYYPERSVWYREETERLLREIGYHWPNRATDGPFLLTPTAIGVSVRVYAASPYLPTFHLHLQATTLDDAWEQIYAAAAKLCGRSRR